MIERRKRIAIVGANFAGLTAAIKLSRRHAVTVIDANKHFEWMPNIHEILSSVKTPRALRLDRAAIVAQAGHHFLRDRVTALQPAQRRLATAGGRQLDFDACIVAVGCARRVRGELHASPPGPAGLGQAAQARVRDRHGAVPELRWRAEDHCGDPGATGESRRSSRTWDCRPGHHPVRRPEVRRCKRPDAAQL